MIKVLKFGGTSVGSHEMMRKVADIVLSEEATVVVLSAMSGTTDGLLSIVSDIKEGKLSEAKTMSDTIKERHLKTAKELLATNSFIQKAEESVNAIFATINEYIEQPEYLNANRIIASGEILSTTIFTYYLTEKGCSAHYLSAFDFIIKREDGAVNSNYISNYFGNLDIKNGTIYITQGFIARSHDGSEDNLGRGGSDYTAALIGAAIGANEVQIWSDIDGIHNNDPRYVEGTRGVDMMCFEEAAELAYFGAKVLHPSTMQPCRERHIPVKLKNSMAPEAFGTVISDYIDRKRTFTAIAAKDGITIIRINSTRMLMAYGFLRRVFEVFERWTTPIDMITTSEVSVALTIDDTTNLSSIVCDLIELGSIEVEGDNSIVSIVGNLEYDRQGIIKEIMDSLSAIPVKMISYGASNRSISLLVATENKVDSLRLIHKYIFK